MGKDYILVIDEGTTGTRAILFDKKFQIAEQSYEEFCQHTPDRKSTRLNSSHNRESRMPSSA